MARDKDYDESYGPEDEEIEDDLDLDEDDDDESGLLPSERRQQFIDPGVEDEELDEEDADEADRIARELAAGLEDDEALGRAGADE